MKLQKPNKGQRSILAQSFIVILSLTAGTLLSMLLRATYFSEINIVVIYILSVLMVARFTRGYFWGILASVIGMFCFNFFFTAPYHTFNVYNKSYLVTFSVMLIASMLTSALTSKILRSSRDATRREKETNMLYSITSSLAKATSVADVATISVQCLSNLFDCDVSCITVDDACQLSTEYRVRRNECSVVVHDVTDGRRKSVIQENNIWPIADPQYQYGLICFPKNRASATTDQSNLLSAICTQVLPRWSASVWPMRRSGRKTRRSVKNSKAVCCGPFLMICGLHWPVLRAPRRF